MKNAILKAGFLTGFLGLLLGSCSPSEIPGPAPSDTWTPPNLVLHASGYVSGLPTSTISGTETPLASPTPTRPSPTNTKTIFPDTPTVITAPIELAFVGDIMLGRTIGTRIQHGGADQVFASVQSLLQTADIAVGNLESAIGNTGSPAKKAYTFRAPVESAKLLKNAGFDVLTLANNHILDYGDETLSQTIDLLHQNSIATIGAGRNETQARLPACLTIRGMRITFLDYMDVPVEYNGFNAMDWIAGPHQPGVSWAQKDRISQDIQNLQATSDFIVVLLHFGIEGSSTASADQKDLAHFAIQSGADLVVGAHSHMVQPIERYQGGVIAYGLGNFVFDGFYGAYNKSVILVVTLAEDNSLEYQSIPVNIINGFPTLDSAFKN